MKCSFTRLWTDSSAKLAARRKSWAHPIRRAYEVDPLPCPCSQRIRVVGFITQAIRHPLQLWEGIIGQI